MSFALAKNIQNEHRNKNDNDDGDRHNKGVRYYDHNEDDYKVRINDRDGGNNSNTNNKMEMETTNNFNHNTTGLRRRKSALSRRNIKDDSADHDHDKCLARNPNVFSHKDIKTFSSVGPLIHLNTPVNADGYYTPENRSRSNSPTNRNSPKMNPKSIYSKLKPLPLDDVNAGDNGNKITGYTTGGSSYDKNQQKEEESDFYDDIMRKKGPNNLTKTKEGTETTANLSSSRTSLSIDANYSVASLDFNPDDKYYIGEMEKSIELIPANLPAPNKMPTTYKEVDEEKGSGLGYIEEGNKGECFDNESDDEMISIDHPGDHDNSNDGDTRSTESDNNLWRKFQKSRVFVGMLVNQEIVQLVVIVLIVINAIMMGIQTLDVIHSNPDINKIFNKVDKAFLIVFTVEISMQLYYHGIALFQDGWLVFDLVIVAISWGFEQFTVVRSFRIFRAFRLVTRLKPLRDLVLALGDVLPRLYAIFVLLLIIFYIFSVLFTELFSEVPMEVNYFRTLDASLFTCMQMMTLEWGDVTRELMQHPTTPWAWAPIMVFVTICGFIVFNLFVAVVVEAVGNTEDTLREMEDWYENATPEAKLADAQERIDLLQSHINTMMVEQEQVQSMLELMGDNLLELENELMRAEQRETDLRKEINRRIEHLKSVETKQAVQQRKRVFMHQRSNSEKLRQSGKDGSQHSFRRNDSRRDSRQDSFAASSSSLLSDEASKTPKPKRKKSVGIPTDWLAQTGTSSTSRRKMEKTKSGQKNLALTGNTRDGSLGAMSCPDDLLSAGPDHQVMRSAPTTRRVLKLNDRLVTVDGVPSQTSVSPPNETGVSDAKANWKKVLAIKPL